jgi:hypothetical protein
MSASNKGPGVDSRLQNLTNALYVDGNDDIVVRTGFAGNIVISGNVNVPGVITVDSSPDDPVHVHLTELGTFGNLTTYVPVQGSVTVTGNANVVVTGNVAGITTLPAITGNVGVSGNVSITSMPGIAVTSLPEVEIKNDSGNPIPVTGNVTATITDVITVLVNEDAGDLYAFNNHAANANRGWTMDNTMRPVISIRNGSASAADLIKIVEYEIGNNNANQSTIVYEWYEGPLTIAGAAIPSWTTFGQHSQYRVYQDQYSSNQGNTFTVPAGTYMRHSGIIIGKNTSGDEGPASMHGGATDADKNMLTLCMKRVDNATKLDVWFAFTVRELT